MPATESSRAELEALNLEGGAEQAPEQPRRFMGYRLAAAAVGAALALAAVGAVALHRPVGGGGAAALAVAAAPAAPAETTGGGAGTVQLFVDRGCNCDCQWATAPGACQAHNDGSQCFQCCCGFGGGFVVDPEFGVNPPVQGNDDAYHGGYYPGDNYHHHTVVVHHHWYGSSHGGLHPNFWWYILFVVLLVLGCVGTYFFCCKR